MKYCKPLCLALMAGLVLCALCSELRAQNTVEPQSVTSGKIEELQYQLQKSEKRLQQTQYGLYGTVFLIVVSKIWLGTVIFSLRRKKRVIKAQVSELGLLNKDISESNRYLEELIDEKKYLVSLIAHDLRTPLSVIRFSLEEARQDAEQLGEAAKVRIREMRQSAGVIERMTQRIIEVAQGGVDTNIQRVQVEVHNIVHTVFNEYHNLARYRNINLVFHQESDHDLIVGDAFLLERVLGNLISNAIRVSPGGGNVEVQLRNKEGWVVLRVQDMGPGIKPELFPELFEPKTFARRSEKNRQLVHGYGLYMSRIYVQKMKGKLEAGNAPQGGAIFTLLFPAVSREAGQGVQMPSIQ